MLSAVYAITLPLRFDAADTTCLMPAMPRFFFFSLMPPLPPIFSPRRHCRHVFAADIPCLFYFELRHMPLSLVGR